MQPGEIWFRRISIACIQRQIALAIFWKENARDIIPQKVWEGNLPRRNVNGLHTMSKTPGTSQTRTTTKKQATNFIAITDLISLYLFRIPRAP
jgi:hypothetical protein